MTQVPKCSPEQIEQGRVGRPNHERDPSEQDEAGWNLSTHMVLDQTFCGHPSIHPGK